MKYFFKKNAIYILLLIWLLLPIFSVKATGLGIGADVPNNGQNNYTQIQIQTDPVLPKPAENKYLNDFWANLVTQENSKRPINHTLFDMVFGWAIIILGTLLIVLLPVLIYLLIRHFQRKLSKKRIRSANK